MERLLTLAQPVFSPADIAHVVARHWRRFLRFGVVGAGGVLLNSLILFALVQGAGWPPLLGAMVATELTILANFALNDRWTFRDVERRLSWIERAARYNAVALGGLAISLSILAFLTTALHVHYLVANLIAIAASTLWNYGGNVKCTWSEREPALGASAPHVPGRDQGAAR